MPEDIHRWNVNIIIPKIWQSLTNVTYPTTIDHMAEWSQKRDEVIRKFCRDDKSDRELLDDCSL